MVSTPVALTESDAEALTLKKLATVDENDALGLSRPRDIKSHKSVTSRDFEERLNSGAPLAPEEILLSSFYNYKTGESCHNSSPQHIALSYVPRT